MRLQSIDSHGVKQLLQWSLFEYEVAYITSCRCRFYLNELSGSNGNTGRSVKIILAVCHAPGHPWLELARD